MFYRPGGSDQRINAQFDEVYTDLIDGATGWLPVNYGNEIGVNIARASIVYNNAASSVVTRSPMAYEAVIVMEQKLTGLDGAWPMDEWQNIVVATKRTATRDGWVRLRVLNINNMDGDGVSLALQVSRNTGR